MMLPWQQTKAAFYGEISSENPEVISLLLATPFLFMYRIQQNCTCLCGRRCVYVSDDKKIFGTNLNKQIYVLSNLCTETVKSLLENADWKRFSFFSTRKCTLNVAFPLILFYIKMYFVCIIVCYEHVYYSMKLEIDFGALLFCTLGGFKWFPLLKIFVILKVKPIFYTLLNVTIRCQKPILTKRKKKFFRNYISSTNKNVHSISKSTHSSFCTWS